MIKSNKDSMKLSDLIRRVKQDLLSEEVQVDTSGPLFVIDEVTIEINFTVSDEMEGGFDLKIVKVGETAGNEQVQKAVVRMKPIVPYETLVKEFEKRQPDVAQKSVEGSVVLLRGKTSSSDDVPKRQS